MKKIRILIFSFLIIAGVCLIAVLSIKHPDTQLDSTLAPIFQLFGRTTKSLNRALTKIMPVDALDEKEYGDAIAEKYGARTNMNSPEFHYLNDIIKGISAYKKKPFSYRVFILDYSVPNAFALPGGIIFVTRGLLRTLRNEAELSAILAHEMGHIELSHCLDTVRFELLSKKIGSESLGRLADFAMNLLLRHSFSKTQENEADEYSFALIRITEYNPASVGNAFATLLNYMETVVHTREPETAHPIRDYFSTHPPLTLRTEKFTEESRKFWEKHQGQRRYRGNSNLRKRKSYYTWVDKKEWVTE